MHKSVMHQATAYHQGAAQICPTDKHITCTQCKNGISCNAEGVHLVHVIIIGYVDDMALVQTCNQVIGVQRDSTVSVTVV